MGMDVVGGLVSRQPPTGTAKAPSPNSQKRGNPHESSLLHIGSGSSLSKVLSACKSAAGSVYYLTYQIVNIHRCPRSGHGTVGIPDVLANLNSDGTAEIYHLDLAKEEDAQDAQGEYGVFNLFHGNKLLQSEDF